MKDLSIVFLIVVQCFNMNSADSGPKKMCTDVNVPFGLVNGMICQDLNKKFSIPLYACTNCNGSWKNFPEFVRHKHKSGTCPSAFKNHCVDCKMEYKENALIENEFVALEHVKNVHTNLSKIHCYLCGYWVEKDRYEDHLNFYMVASEKKQKVVQLGLKKLEESEKDRRAAIRIDNSAVFLPLYPILNQKN